MGRRGLKTKQARTDWKRMGIMVGGSLIWFWVCFFAARSFFTNIFAEKTNQTDSVSMELQAEQMGQKECIAETKDDKMDAYYGCYRITQFCPTIYWGNYKFDCLPQQEADMMLGRIVVLEPQRLVTYDSERRLGTREGRAGFAGNFIIEEYTIENPHYTYQAVTADGLDISQKPDKDMKGAIGNDFFEQLENIITILQLCSPFGTQYFYTLADTDKLILYSTLSNQYFLLERDNQNQTQELPPLSEEQKKQLLEDAYGVYEITAFLPTKYYPAVDSCGYEKLPQKEADLMLGQEILIEKSVFATYDNFRSPNSYIANRLTDGFWIRKAEIENPEYHVERRLREEIYGLRDDMLPKELVQEDYIEIDVYPGYPGYDMTLPQLFLTENGKIILYAMGEYFLLECRLRGAFDMEVSQDGRTVMVKIDSQDAYRVFLNQFANGSGYHSLDINLCNTDTVIYLDEILSCQDIGYLYIRNGGIIRARNAAALQTDSLYRIGLYDVLSLQESLFSGFRGRELCIRLDRGYTGALPTAQVFENTDCESIALIWDGADAPKDSGQCEGAQWDYFDSVLPEEERNLKGCYRTNQDGYSYTSYEFCAENSDEVCAAFVCIEENGNSDKTAFDILELPKSALPDISRLEGRRIRFGDVNFDGYEDLIYIGYNNRVEIYYKCTGFLWDNGEKKYQLCETMPPNFKRIDEERRRLVYSTSGSAFEDTYYIYKYDQNRFVEERLEVQVPQTDDAVLWKYFKENELLEELTVEDQADGAYHVFYRENGTVREETLAGAEVQSVWEIGKRYFPEFDFYHFG